MKNNFTEAMAKRTDEELITIATTLRKSYEPDAVAAAEIEIQKRNLDTSKIDEIKIEIAKKHNESELFLANLAPLSSRFINYLIDSFAVVIVLILFALIADLSLKIEDENTEILISYFLFVIAFFTYYVFMESKYQKTLGKFITKTKVVNIHGTKPKFGDIVIRTLFRIIPFDNISYLFTRRGFHDYLSKTSVVKD